MAEPLRLLIDTLDTPIGDLAVIADRQGNLRTLEWTEHEERMRRALRLHYAANGFVLEPARDPGGFTSALRAYFAGDLAAIDRLPTATGGTPFQRLVWRALRDIPCGTTVSYSELARRIGHPEAVRAVGLANGANPISIVVPCHRVIGASGALTGYGGGIERKRWLLAHEGVITDAAAGARYRQRARQFNRVIARSEATKQSPSGDAAFLWEIAAAPWRASRNDASVDRNECVRPIPLSRRAS